MTSAAAAPQPTSVAQLLQRVHLALVELATQQFLQPAKTVYLQCDGEATRAMTRGANQYCDYQGDALLAQPGGANQYCDYQGDAPFAQPLGLGRRRLTAAPPPQPQKRAQVVARGRLGVGSTTSKAKKPNTFP